jgi:hypothetical protein
MDKTIKTLILLGMMLGMCGNGVSQESVNAAGGDAMGAGGTASYSVGQVVYTTIGENGTTVAQGVQQAYQPEAIPTMSEWGIMIMLLLFIIIAVQGLKVKKQENIKFTVLQHPE